jgi:arginase family enzyme
MKDIHFFAAYSRLGLINPPHGSNKFNYGVEIAPDFVLNDNFLNNFSSYKVDKFTFSKPERVIKENYQKIIAKESLSFANLINQKLKPQEIQIVIGGDHSVAFGSVLSLLDRYKPAEIAYVHFDSHADTSSMADSPSQNFHGQFLRALIDENFDHKDLRKLKKNNLLAKNTIIIGNLESDDFDYIEEAGIQYFDGQDSSAAINAIKKIGGEVKHLHISFDIDVFANSLVTATGTPNSWGGLNKSQIWPILEELSKLKDISIDLVEVNPQKIGAIQTTTIAQEVLLKLLEIS